MIETALRLEMLVAWQHVACCNLRILFIVAIVINSLSSSSLLASRMSRSLMRRAYTLRSPRS